MIIGNGKGVNNIMYGLASLQVRQRAVMDAVLIWLPHRKCIVKILIGCQTFKQKDFEIFLVGHYKQYYK